MGVVERVDVMSTSDNSECRVRTYTKKHRENSKRHLREAQKNDRDETTGMPERINTNGQKIAGT